MACLSDELFPTQTELPPLPLPELSDTCERYLRSVRPLLTDAEYAHTEAVVADFQREGGEGEALQEFLSEKASSERNWMEGARSAVAPVLRPLRRRQPCARACAGARARVPHPSD